MREQISIKILIEKDIVPLKYAHSFHVVLELSSVQKFRTSTVTLRPNRRKYRHMTLPCTSLRFKVLLMLYSWILTEATTRKASNFLNITLECLPRLLHALLLGCNSSTKESNSGVGCLLFVPHLLDSQLVESNSLAYPFQADEYHLFF